MRERSTKALMRGASCSGCDFEDTHEGDGCYMFPDRGVCYVKRISGPESKGKSLSRLGR